MRGPREIVPTPEHCPWGGWAPPDIQHCEENLCAWIAAPSDSWSNLAYLAVALWLWRHPPRGAARIFAPLLVFIGVTSFLFHASFTAAFQLFDYAAMFALFLTMLGLDLHRERILPESGLPRFVVATTAASLALFLGARRLGFPVQPLVVMQALAVLGAEIHLGLQPSRPRYGWFIAAVALACAGFALWLLDYSRIVCDPRSVWQGHAAWHLLTALAIGALARHYGQFAK